MTGDDEATARLLRQRARNGPLWVPVSGVSMGPRYAAAARVLVSPMDRAPRLGEIWVFCMGGTLVAHRFLVRRRSGLVFAGDAMRHVDAPVLPASLVGRVVSIDGPEGHWRPRARHAWAPVLLHARRAVRKRVLRLGSPR